MLFEQFFMNDSHSSTNYSLYNETFLESKIRLGLTVYSSDIFCFSACFTVWITGALQIF